MHIDDAKTGVFPLYTVTKGWYNYTKTKACAARLIL